MSESALTPGRLHTTEGRDTTAVLYGIGAMGSLVGTPRRRRPSCSMKRPNATR